MKAGDKVYYLHTNQLGCETKFAAMVIAVEDDGIFIRVGRLNVDLQEIKTFESLVPAKSLVPRNTPCSFEDELKVHTTAR
ncbi:MAG: hypothetical protein ACI9V8_001859 [Urechidicola sp.]|jgi:hypothetical protein